MKKMKPLHRARQKSGKQEHHQKKAPGQAARCSVYTLRFPDTRLVFYVGIAEDVTRRFTQHLRLDGSNREKDACIRQIQARGWMPLMQIEISLPERKQAEYSEMFYVGYYHAAKHPLTNQDIHLLSTAMKAGRTAYEEEQRAKLYKSRVRFVLAWLRTWTMLNSTKRLVHFYQLQEYAMLNRPGRAESIKHWPALFLAQEKEKSQRIEPIEPVQELVQEPVSTPPEKKEEINRFSSFEEKAREVERLRGLNFRQGEIMLKIWGVKPGANKDYQEALAEYKEIIAYIVRGA